MKRFLAILLTLVLVSAGITSPSLAQTGITQLEPLTPLPTTDSGEMVDETAEMWFVELSSAPLADGGNGAALQKDKANFTAEARKADIYYSPRLSFDTLWNGISVWATPSEAVKIARLPGVKTIYPVEIIAMPEVTTGETPELFTALAMTGADIAQSELGYTGKGIKVAVMDTGIDYDHPDLGGCFGPDCRVAYGYDLVGDVFNADPTSPSYNETPSPDDDPDDCNGHGTHVAGIIGANGIVTGVAPDVTYGAYRVFGCEGSTTADIMLAAMEMALADDMDVLNMSIGSAYQWPQYPTAQAASRLVTKGMVVVASIGNNGTNGLYSAGAPGLGDKVIGVASYDNSHVYLPYFTVNNQPIGYITMTYSPPPPTSGTFEIVNVGLACDPLTVNLTGKVALAARGTCAFSVKAINASNAGAAAVVISNNAPGIFNGTLGAVIPGIAPTVGISQEDGNFIRSQTAPVYMTWTDQQASFPSPTGGLISSFSSYGLSPDLALKPDIGAPGGNIYSTYPLEKGGYATMGGTSMSTPHVTGAVALLLQAKPKTPPQVVRTILQNSADPKNWWGNPGLGYLENVHRQGAGMLDIDDAILATLKIEPGKISAGEGETGPFTQDLTIENTGKTTVTYTLSYVNALSTGGVITPSFYVSDAWVEFSKTTLKVKAGSTATVKATIYPAAGPLYGQYGGYIVFTPEGGQGQTYRVPFAGFVGDYQGIQVLTAGPSSEYPMPWIAILYDAKYYQITNPLDWTFTMIGTDVPYFLIHLEHQSRKLLIEIYDAKGKSWQRAYNEEYLPRNATSTGFFAFPFDGTTIAGKKVQTVPDGTYYAVVKILKALGDEDNPLHWETWTSPMFVIDRP